MGNHPKKVNVTLNLERGHPRTRKLYGLAQGEHCARSVGKREKRENGLIHSVSKINLRPSETPRQGGLSAGRMRGRTCACFIRSMNARSCGKKVGYIVNTRGGGGAPLKFFTKRFGQRITGSIVPVICGERKGKFQRQLRV